MDKIEVKNGLYLDDLLEICRKNKGKELLLRIDGKTFPLKKGHYIVDEMWFNEVDLENKDLIQGIDFVGECEDEGLSDDWGGLYQSPMEHLGSCEIKFIDNLSNVDEIIDEMYEEDYEQFKVIEIIIDENSIIIELKENEILSYCGIKNKLSKIEVDSKLFWKTLILGFIENMLEQGDDNCNIEITKKDLDDMVEEISSYDELWETIDSVISDLVSKYNKYKN